MLVGCFQVTWDSVFYHSIAYLFFLAPGQKSRADTIGLTSDEDSVNDNGSVISIVSETKSIIEEGEL